MNVQPSYPTPQHRYAAEAVVEFFARRGESEAILLVNSCARGKATPDSCLDIAVLVRPERLAANQARLEHEWRDFYTSHPPFEQLRRVGRFSVVHFDYIDGRYEPSTWDDGGGPDGFELQIGNQLAYGVPLWQGTDYLPQLKAQWLPYYEESLRTQKLAMVRKACAEDLEHIPWFVRRELYFAAFDRLYKAFQQFLQALFISRRTYPIAYNKWIREHVEQILGEPELYRQLLPILQITQLEGSELVEKARLLQSLLMALDD
jgi:hypothetical protein